MENLRNGCFQDNNQKPLSEASLNEELDAARQSVGSQPANMVNRVDDFGENIR